MIGDSFPNLTTAAEALIDTLALVEPERRAVVIEFDPAAGPERHTLYSNAAAVDLVPVLRAVLVRLESGTLRMPVTDAVRWVDVDGGEGG
jgi:hypothetical protein